MEPKIVILLQPTLPYVTTKAVFTDTESQQPTLWARAVNDMQFSEVQYYYCPANRRLVVPSEKV